MTWLDRILGRPPAVDGSSVEGAAAPSKGRPAFSVNARALAGGRVSTDQSDDPFVASLTAAPDDPHNRWASLDLDTQTLLRASPDEILSLLGDISPEVSRAAWDTLRLCNPGWEAKAIRLGSKDDAEDVRGQAALDAYLETLKGLYGSVDVVINKLYWGAFFRGAFCGEVVLDGRGRVPVDFATPDPASIRFRSRLDPLRGPVWVAGQYQAGTTFVWLDQPTFRYLPVDPSPGKAPYGRPLANPGIFVAVFLVALLHDLKRVIQQQGYARLNIEVDLDALARAFPDDARIAEDFEAVIGRVIDEVKQVYEQLEPDDAYIHTSAVKVNPPVGVDASSLAAVDGMIQGLERMAVRGLKSMPLLFGITDGASEANSNRQWEIYVAGVRSLQHLCESLLEHLLETALRAQGIQTDVEFRFAELRAAEELRDEQTRQLRLNNFMVGLDEGLVDREEVAQEVFGHAPAVSDDELEQKRQEMLAQFGQGQGQNDPNDPAQNGETSASPAGQVDGQEGQPPDQADPGSQRVAILDYRRVLDQLDALTRLLGVEDAGP